ncbi:hypothetical protein RHGRI_025929 [Rhododendron griersonianum]|uniref:Uncharacterized protein n=1 Tax=Rhododendron griersonianum TaxID=479676 RepID=A0AAV6IUF0_9ERIC|nr:hypothetical protein RHGRI_025929 [Rhododendron griersonianum]
MIHIDAFKDCPACIPILEAEYEVRKEALDHLKEAMGQKYFNCIVTIRNRIIEHRDLYLKHMYTSQYRSVYMCNVSPGLRRMLTSMESVFG